jgi:hypothetical protein
MEPTNSPSEEPARLKKTGGRPAKEKAQKATFQAKTLLTESERLKLEEEYEFYAVGRSTSFSAFLRERILQGSSAREKVGRRERETAFDLLYSCQELERQLERVAQNYSQVVKRINSLPCSHTLQAELQKSNEVIGAVSDYLQTIDSIKQGVEIWLSGLPTEKM